MSLFKKNLCASLIKCLPLLILGTSALAIADTNDDRWSFFEKKVFNENPVVLPTEVPNPKNLVPFFPSPDSTLSFALDRKSLLVGSDDVVRYIVVISGPNGMHQTVFEGVRCDTYEYRSFAFLEDDGTWKLNSLGTWKRIPNQGYNQYQSKLARSGFCIGTDPNSSIEQMFTLLPTL